LRSREFGGHNVGGIKSGVSVVNSATLLFPWLGELGTVLLEHKKFCARNVSSVL